MGDFEELKEGESVVQHLIAGAAAGTVEHCGLFPIDTIKTNIQAIRPGTSPQANIGVIKTTQILIQQHGVLGLFRGITAVAAGAAPAHAMHFATYEFCKERFVEDKHGHNPVGTGLAGICATIVSDAILTPMDAVKQRMQLRARNYSGVLDCVRTVVRHEGPSALYAGYTTTLFMNIPYNAVYFSTYESLRRLLKRGTEEEFDPLAHLLSGAGAGMLAAAVTNPMDVARTRLQTQGEMQGGVHYNGMVNTMITIWREEGRKGFLRGIQPRVAFYSVSSSLCWFTYEAMKHGLAKIGIGGVSS